MGLADQSGRFDVFAMLDRQEFAAHQTRHRRPADDGDRQHDRDGTRLHDRHQHDRQGEIGNGLEELGEAHQRIVDLAAKVARQRPQRHADGKRHHGGNQPDQQRHPGAVGEPGGDVAPHDIGAEPEPGDFTGRQERPLHHAPWRVGIEERRQQGQQYHQPQNYQPPQGTTILGEAFEETHAASLMRGSASR